MTPLRSMRKRRMVQLPLLMALSMPWLIISTCRFFAASNSDARLLLDSVLSACRVSGSDHPSLSRTAQYHTTLCAVD